ncbi:abscisic acid receptor PYL4-like [Canna indica]|uniref:Abscisic acid receptor PYL4-like n=1 Tax=Canna indica TaxID=4628 RepID=A0AAQ3L8A0_9LILI|nr:abscisic acid receptor PYL4-like [Canna indica]
MAVWSIVWLFNKLHAYKHFVKSCNVLIGDNDVGTLCEVHVVSGLPAATSTSVSRSSMTRATCLTFGSLVRTTPRQLPLHHHAAIGLHVSLFGISSTKYAFKRMSLT